MQECTFDSPHRSPDAFAEVGSNLRSTNDSSNFTSFGAFSHVAIRLGRFARGRRGRLLQDGGLRSATYRRDDKVEKRARLRGEVVTRWMQRIERKSLIKPARKDDLQSSTLNRRFDSRFQELCNTVTGEADCVNCRNIAEQQLCV